MEWLNLGLLINPLQVALADGGLIRHVSQCLPAGNDASASRATTQQGSRLDIDHLPTPAGIRRRGGQKRPKNPKHQPFFGPLHGSAAFPVAQHTRP